MERKSVKKCSEKWLPIQWFYCLIMIITVHLMFTTCTKNEEYPELEVEQETITLDANGKAALWIHSNTIWEITSQPLWLSFSTMSGKGDKQVQIKIVEDTLLSSSEGSFVVATKDGSISHEISVKIVLLQNVLSNETYTVNGISFKMIGITGGTFLMGATPDQSPYEWEKPAHNVCLSSFRIGQTEVTQELWDAVMGSHSSGGSHFEGPKKPVGFVSWDKCQEFITKLNQITGMIFRLPTEAEWEFAARGGIKSHGYKYAGSESIEDVAWWIGNTYSKGYSSLDYGTHEVATKMPNELGIYDMSGNVCEWCQDWFHNDYYSLISDITVVNPTGPANNSPTYGYHRVHRGGSWGDSEDGCRVSRRESKLKNESYNDIGLRLAL